LMLLAGTVCWWLVLMHKSREVAQEESRKQTWLLMQEIDAHRRTDEQLQQAKQAADAANQAKTRYISTVSHELRTPLNSILGYAQLLQEDEHLSDHRAHALKVIHRGGEHLLSLIEGTLDIARIESGKLTLQPQPMAFAEHVQEVAHLFELQAQAKGLCFVFEVPQPLPDLVRADAKRLRQILINLLGNAVKFTHRGEVRLRVTHAREMATFEVHDTGPGMAPHELERVFEPFARGLAPGVEAAGLHPQASGTGLGLTIAKMLTDLMGGELTVRSTVGAGTVFAVRLFLPVQHGPAPRKHMVPAVSGYTGPRLSVLVVDNEEADRDLLASWLEPLGFEVVKATHGEDALRCLSGGLRPAAVFMDLAMPGIDGWETMRRMRSDGWGAVPVLVVSANAFDQGLDNDLGHAAQDFLVKPVRRVDVLGWLQRRLDLTWEPGAASQTEPTFARPGTTVLVPTQVDTGALLAAVRLGHAKGVVQWLDVWVQAHPEHAEWAQQMRALARAFRFEVLESRLTALP
jgi:signal transduction histidine kinase/FixJ family two-component response regulator